MTSTRAVRISATVAMAAVLTSASPAYASDFAVAQQSPAQVASAVEIDDYPLTVDSGSWDAGHIQGIAVDVENGYVYHSFTQILVKTDLLGNVIGTVEGFTGHLGDLDFNTDDGRVYGSLEYKAEESFYIAIFDVDKITEVGMDAEDSGIVTAVYLEEVVEDFTADMDGNGVFDGDTPDTADHRYGSSGIDGVSFGPAFGATNGTQQLMVAYGIYSNNARTDNDYQVVLQYDVSRWGMFEQPLAQADPHQSGPSDEDAKYFVYTGSTHFGVQNLAYDEHSGLWYLGVYRGSKPQFPNRTMYVIDGSAAPRVEPLLGQPVDETGLVVPLLQDGIPHEPTGVYGWEFKSDVGIEPVGDGYFYVARDFDDYSSGHLQESATLELYRWTGEGEAGFEQVLIDIAVTLTGEKESGRVVLTARAVNEGDVPVTLAAITPFGRVSLGTIAPAATKSVSVNTRLPWVPKATITVLATAPDGTTRTYDVTYSGSGS